MGLPRPEDERGVYGISVAAELVGTGVQNLRLYEARGLLEPERTKGGTRRYSANDLDRLCRISDLLQAGLNLAGIGMVVDLEAQNHELRGGKGPAVAEDRIDPADQIPKGDPLEQHTPLTPQSLIDTESASLISDSPWGPVDARVAQIVSAPRTANISRLPARQDSGRCGAARG